jgi:hypothetical protein
MGGHGAAYGSVDTAGESWSLPSLWATETGKDRENTLLIGADTCAATGWAASGWRSRLGADVGILIALVLDEALVTQPA